MFIRPDMHGLFNRGFYDLRSILRVTDDGIVVHRELLSPHFSFKNLRPLFDLVAETYPLVFAKKLEHGEQFAVRVGIPLDGRIHAGAEHLLQIRPWHPARRDVVAVWLSAELRIERQRDLCDM